MNTPIRTATVRTTTPISINIAKPVDKVTDFYELEDGCDRVFSRTEVRKMHVVPAANSIVFVHRLTGETPRAMCRKIDADFR